MPHRSSLFSSSSPIFLSFSLSPSLSPSFDTLLSFSLSLPLYPTSRRLFLFRLYSAPAREKCRHSLSSLSLSPLSLFLFRSSLITSSCPRLAHSHLRRAIDKVILITESCFSLISDRYNHKPPVLSLAASCPLSRRLLRYSIYPYN